MWRLNGTARSANGTASRPCDASSSRDLAKANLYDATLRPKSTIPRQHSTSDGSSVTNPRVPSATGPVCQLTGPDQQDSQKGLQAAVRVPDWSTAQGLSWCRRGNLNAPSQRHHAPRPVGLYFAQPVLTDRSNPRGCLRGSPGETVADADGRRFRLLIGHDGDRHHHLSELQITLGVFLMRNDRVAVITDRDR